MSAYVHTIRYRWSESSLLGTRGMGPVETSLPLDQLNRWDGHLRDRVWAASAEPGFTFVTHEGVGALIRKHTTTAAEGRPGSHAQALLGEQLTAAIALGLTSWEGWADAASKALDWTVLELAAGRGLAEVRSRAQAVPPGRLADLLTQLMQAPSSSYTVIGEQDPVALICAFGDLLGEFPTFASDEPDDTRADLPTAVFLRSVGFSPTAVTRRRLTAQAGDDPELSAFASAAAEAYIGEGLTGIVALQRNHPPADLKEVREWSQRAQYVPGVLRDLALLPRLSPASLAKLTVRDALDRIRADAAAASASRLMRSLDRTLPGPVQAILIGETLSRIGGGPVDRSLLDRLAELAPLPAAWVTLTKSMAFADVARITQRLLAPADRETFLQSASRDSSVPGLIFWIDEHAARDPAGARAVYIALRDRLRRASGEDVRALFSKQALSRAVRQFTTSEEESAAVLTTLLMAIPSRALDQENITRLAAHGDPALVKALSSVTHHSQRHRRRLWPLFRARPRHSSITRKKN